MLLELLPTKRDWQRKQVVRKKEKIRKKTTMKMMVVAVQLGPQGRGVVALVSKQEPGGWEPLAVRDIRRFGFRMQTICKGGHIGESRFTG